MSPRPSNVGSFWQDGTPPYFIPGMNDRESQTINYVEELAGLVNPIRTVLADYTLQLADAGRIVATSTAGPTNLIVPKNANVPFPIGTRIVIAQMGPGNTYVNPVDGTVTISSFGGNIILLGQYAMADLIKTGSDTWLLNERGGAAGTAFGDLRSSYPSPNVGAILGCLATGQGQPFTYNNSMTERLHLPAGGGALPGGNMRKRYVRNVFVDSNPRRLVLFYKGYDTTVSSTYYEVPIEIVVRTLSPGLSGYTRSTFTAGYGQAALITPLEATGPAAVLPTIPFPPTLVSGTVYRACVVVDLPARTYVVVELTYGGSASGEINTNTETDVNTGDKIWIASLEQANTGTGTWADPMSGGGGGGGVVMAARMYRNTGMSLTSGSYTKLPLDTVSFDTSSMASVANSRIVAPVAGYYQVDAQMTINTGASSGAIDLEIAVYKNGVTNVTSGGSSQYAGGATSAFAQPTLSDVIYLNKGEYVELWYYVSAAWSLASGMPSRSFLSLSLISSVTGTQAPVTAARAYRAAALSVSATTWTKVPVDTITFDPAGNFNLANGRYICPATGFYQVHGCVEIAEASTANAQLLVALYRNGQIVSQTNNEGTFNLVWTSEISDVIQCNAGDYLELYVYNSSTQSLAISSTVNFLSAVMVGQQMEAPAATSMACRAHISSAAALTAGVWTKVALNTVDFDTSGMVDATNNHRINILQSGYYQVDGSGMISGLSAAGVYNEAIVAAYVNGLQATSGMSDTAVQNYSAAGFSDIMKLNAGDYIELWVYSQVTGTSINQSWQYTYLAASLISTVSAGIAPVTAARAYRNAAMSLFGGWARIAFDTASFDPGGNINSTTSRYTCPATGYYQVNGQIELTTSASNQRILLSIYKNGVAVAWGDEETFTSGINAAVTVSDVIQCNAGDYLELFAYCGGGTPALNVGTSLSNYFSVVMVGNMTALTAIQQITNPGWTYPTLSNSWVSGVNGTVNPALGYFKDPFGFVHIRGTCLSGINNTAAFVLPPQFRPGQQLYSPGVQGGGTAGGYVGIDPSGNVTINMNVATSNGLHCDIPPFLAEN